MRTLDLKNRVLHRLPALHNTYISGVQGSGSGETVLKVKQGTLPAPPFKRPLITLISALAQHAPVWEYYLPLGAYQSDTRQADELYVMHNGETIAWVRTDGDSFDYDTILLDKKRERGSWSTTKSYDKLLSVLKKNIVSRTPDERLDAILAKGKKSIESELNKEAYGFQRERNLFTTKITGPLLANWNTIAALGVFTKEAMDMGHILSARVPEYEETTALQSKLDRVTIPVILDGNHFLFKTSRMATYTRLPREEVTEAMRAAVGILKMSPEETYVAGYGVKHSDTLFTIIMEETTDDGS